MIPLHDSHCICLRELLYDEISDTFEVITGICPCVFPNQSDPITTLMDIVDALHEKADELYN